MCFESRRLCCSCRSTTAQMVASHLERRFSTAELLTDVSPTLELFSSLRRQSMMLLQYSEATLNGLEVDAGHED